MKGNPPFGYKHLDGELVPSADEQSTLEIIKSMRRRKPPLSFGNIAAALNRDSVLNRGKFWNPTTLWYIFNRETKPPKKES